LKKWTNYGQMLLYLTRQITHHYARNLLWFKPSAALGLLSALGALGRRFESCRPSQSNLCFTS